MGGYTETQGVEVYIQRCSPTLSGIVVLVLKRHLVETLFTIDKHFGDFVKCIFTILLQIQHETVIYYLPVNTDKPKLVAFLVFVCTTASFIA